MSLGEESIIDDSIIDEYLKKSIDTRIFNNGLTIEEFPSIQESSNSEPVYATINFKSKYEKRQKKEDKIVEPVVEDLDFKLCTERVYEDLEDKKDDSEDGKKDSDGENIYELVRF